MTDLKAYGNIPLKYGMLKLDLSQYASPKDKIDSLVQEGSLVRLKKGLYVVAEKVSGQPYCMGAIANNLYGPSYVSLETALSYYGMIPERVFTTLSITPKRSKNFTNDTGFYDYSHVPASYYHIGIATTLSSTNCAYLIASAEKALCDILYCLRGHRIQSKEALREFLFEDMRIDLSSLSSFDRDIVEQVISLGVKKKVFVLLLEVLTDEFGC